MTTEEF